MVSVARRCGIGHQQGLTVKKVCGIMGDVLNKSKADDALTIIGIGSSAGGLEAIRELAATLPTDLHVSYVVVQHMSPNHKSLMTELVARFTDLKVVEVEDNTTPQANVIYITPPKTDVIFEDGKLRLVQPSPEIASPKPSVDRFLLSLADGHGDKTMAIILSGTGSDGSYGVQAIREVGGITIAQDAESAKYDHMPQAAIQTGCVDLILRPLDIGTHLQKILVSPRDFSEFRKETIEDSPISDLLQILLARTRVDFREYKQTTIGRRIERRRVALGIESHEEYAQFCRNNPHAVDALFKDLLISVTRFFRDKEEFKQLEALLPQLIEERGNGPLRVWIAGCATGEEAYSIAMMISEALGGPKVDLKSLVQIFATDIDKAALSVARRGVYGAAALNDIPSDLAEKYLINQNDGVRVVDNLRNAILFSDHNVCQDPPFQKVDLICCRNLLIYFGNTLQQKVLSRFHYSMTPRAAMFLGTAESVAGSDALFVPHRDTTHVFRKRLLRSSSQAAYQMPNIPSTQRRMDPRHPANRSQSTDRQLFEALAKSLGKNSVLVADDYSIARVYGNISPFIEVNDSSSLKMHLDLLRSPLREEARSLVTIALKNEGHRSGVRHLLAGSDEEGIRLDVYPIVAKEINERAALIVFTPISLDRTVVAIDVAQDVNDSAVTERIRFLENEIATTREALQQTIEELETSNEELQSLNEELQSTNEELQATNEELETSNEELQSTNEELITVNEELQITATELSGRTGELTSVLQSTPLAILVTDNALQITQATTAATELFTITRPAASPHISQCTLPPGYPPLAPICNEALKLGHTVSQEFSSAGTRVKLSSTPYFDVHGHILGVTVLITEFPGLAREMEMILETSHVMIMNRDKDGKILRISESSAKTLGMTRTEALGQNIYELLGPEVGSEVRAADLEVLKGGKSYSKSTIHFPNKTTGDMLWLELDRFRFTPDGQEDAMIYSVGNDVTETTNARTKAEQLNAELMIIAEFAGVGYWSVDLETQTIEWSPEVFRIHRLEPSGEGPSLESALNYYHPDDVEDVQKLIEGVIETPGEFRFKKRLKCANGEIVNVESFGVSTANEDGKVTKILGAFQEIKPKPAAKRGKSKTTRKK